MKENAADSTHKQTVQQNSGNSGTDLAKREIYKYLHKLLYSSMSQNKTDSNIKSTMHDCTH